MNNKIIETKPNDKQFGSSFGFVLYLSFNA